MTVPAAKFQGLVNWCKQQPSLPLLHHVVFGDLRCYNGDIMEDYFKGVLSFYPSRPVRIFPADFNGTLATVYPGQEFVQVIIALDPAVILLMRFTGGPLNGIAFETEDFAAAPDGSGLFISFFFEPNTYYLSLAAGTIITIPHVGVKVPIAKAAGR